ncbi:response regulator, partial [Acinetobacter baumannii]
VTEKMNSGAPIGAAPKLVALSSQLPGPVASSSSTRILFVEDDKVYFGLLKRIIEAVEDAAFEILWAQNMQSALEILKEQ